MPAVENFKKQEQTSWQAENLVTVADKLKNNTAVVNNKNVLRTNRINIQSQSKNKVQSMPFGVSWARHMLDKIKCGTHKTPSKEVRVSINMDVKFSVTASLGNFRVDSTDFFNNYFLQTIISI